MAIKVRVGDMVIEAETSEDLQTVLAALGHKNSAAHTNGHAAATPPAGDTVTQALPLGQAEPPGDQPAEPPADLPPPHPARDAILSIAAREGGGARTTRTVIRRSRPKRRRGARLLTVSAEASKDERRRALVTHMTPAQQKLYELLLSFPAGVTDEQGQGLLHLDKAHFSGALMSISRAANRLGIELDDVIRRTITRNGRKRSYRYELTEEMRGAVAMK